MNHRAGSVAVLASIVLASALPSASWGQHGNLPPAVEGWVRVDSGVTYEGTDLYLLIDGGADLFLEYGFVRVLSAEYTAPPDASVATELYEMESPAAAYGIFTSFTTGTGSPVSVAQDAILGEGYCIFWKGVHVGMLTGIGAEAPSDQMLVHLARAVAAEFPEAGSPPDLCNRLQAGGLDARAMVFVRGKLALGNHRPTVWANQFPPAEGIVGEADRAQYVVLEYIDGASAEAALDTATARWGRHRVPASEHPGGRWNIPQPGGDVALVEHHERYVLAVSGTEDAAAALLSRLARILAPE